MRNSIFSLVSDLFIHLCAPKVVTDSGRHTIDWLDTKVKKVKQIQNSDEINQKSAMYVSALSREKSF